MITTTIGYETTISRVNFVNFSENIVKTDRNTYSYVQTIYKRIFSTKNGVVI